jgi:hypothetical protein
MPWRLQVPQSTRDGRRNECHLRAPRVAEDAGRACRLLCRATRHVQVWTSRRLPQKRLDVGVRQADHRVAPHGALYFPYIDVPDRPELARVLLYWDELGTIVPESFADEGLGPRTRDLVSAGLVRAVDPRDYYDGLRDFDEGFLGLVDALPPSPVPPGRRLLSTARRCSGISGANLRTAVSHGSRAAGPG